MTDREHDPYRLPCLWITKPSAAPAGIQALLEHGVKTRVLTGDNEKVTQAICERLDWTLRHMLLGADIDQMTDQELAEAVEV